MEYIESNSLTPEKLREENTLKQYFIDNIFGYLVIKKNDYHDKCDLKNKKRKIILIINRNLSILFLTLFLVSFYYKLPYFNK